MQPRYLVTGGVGFIGSHIVRALVDSGESVRVLDDLSGGGAVESLRGTSGDERVQIVIGDICDPKVVKRCVRGIEAVFHLAALVSVPRSVTEPLTAERVNALGTLQLLEAARQARVRRVILAASSAAYGSSPQLPKHESMLPCPMSPYAISKVAAEHYLAAYAELHGLETLSLRYFNVFGPGQDPSGPYAAAIPKFLSSIIAGRLIPIFGDGEQTRDFIYVSDVVDANLLAVNSPKCLHGQVVNIAGGKSTSINLVVEQIRSVVGLPVCVEYLPERAGDIKHSVADIGYAQELLGFEPKVPWQQGVLPTYQAMRRG